MIIWGTKFVKKTLASGTFLCPHCTDERDYKKISGQKYGHVYWIPLFATGNPIEYVECQECNSEWQPSVLSYSASLSSDDFTDQYLGLLRQVLISVAVADGTLASEEVDILQRIYGSFSGGVLLGEEEIRVAAQQLDATAMAGSLRQLGGQLSNEGKESIVKAAILVAYADGEVHDREAQLLAYFAEGLGMSAAHVRGVMTDLATADTDA